MRFGLSQTDPGALLLLLFMNHIHALCLVQNHMCLVRNKFHRKFIIECTCCCRNGLISKQHFRISLISPFVCILPWVCPKWAKENQCIPQHMHRRAVGYHSSRILVHQAILVTCNRIIIVWSQNICNCSGAESMSMSPFTVN